MVRNEDQEARSALGIPLALFSFVVPDASLVDGHTGIRIWAVERFPEILDPYYFSIRVYGDLDLYP